jgi:hypothetical protein
MYGVERSAVALTREVGAVDDRTMLEVSGNEGVGVVVLRSGSVAFGRSHAVCFLLVFGIVNKLRRWHSPYSCRSGI